MKRFGGIFIVERPNDRGDTATAGAPGFRIGFPSMTALKMLIVNNNLEIGRAICWLFAATANMLWWVVPMLQKSKTMVTLSIPLASKSASVTSKSLIELLKYLPLAARKTLTVDNAP